MAVGPAELPVEPFRRGSGRGTEELRCGGAVLRMERFRHFLGLARLKIVSHGMEPEMESGRGVLFFSHVGGAAGDMLPEALHSAAPRGGGHDPVEEAPRRGDAPRRERRELPAAALEPLCP